MTNPSQPIVVPAIVQPLTEADRGEEDGVREWADYMRGWNNCRAEVLAAAGQEEQPHSCSNCQGVDPDTCWTNPNRPPEQCPAAEFEDYGQQCQKPAGHNLCTFQEDQQAAEEPRAVTHARAMQEIRAAARLLNADATIRVLAALDDARVCDNEDPATGGRCNRHHGHFGFHRQVVDTGVYTSWVGEVPGAPAEEERHG